MNRSLLFFALLFSLVLVVLCGIAVESAQAQSIMSLTRNNTIERDLDSGSKHTYELTLGADQFVFGEVDQKSVDVVVTVYGPDGKVIEAFDGPARGREPFKLENGAAGTFRIVVSPFKGSSGRYSITLRRSEPMARTQAARLSQLVASYERDNGPGGVVAVVEHGEVTAVESFGLAEVAHRVPIARTTAFNIASVSKHFTSFAILTLADQGKLSLDDDIRKFFPELRDAGWTITVRHLLTHTNGLREIFGTLGFLGYRDGNNMAHADGLRIATRQKELQFEPGSKYLYNNIGYILLADIVSRVSGAPFPEWIEKNVFKPLGMHHTTVMTRPGTVIPGAASSYINGPSGEYLLDYDNSDVHGSTGIYTTVDDMAKWMGNFHTHTVGAPDLMERMATRGVLNDGDTIDYANGIEVGTHRGLRLYQHSGSTAGFRSIMLYYPSIDAGVIALLNGPQGGLFSTAQNVAEAFFEKHMTPKKNVPAAVATAQTEPQSGSTTTVAARAIDPALLDAYAGRYDVTAARVTVVFTRAGDHLVADVAGQTPSNLIPLTDSTFKFDDVEATITFHRDASGTVTGATHTQGQDFAMRRLASFEPKAVDLGVYAGRYLCPELDVVYTLAVEGDSLVARHPLVIENITLKPKEPDVFASSSWFFTDVIFKRDEGGVVTGMRVSNGRTTGMLFTKQP